MTENAVGELEWKPMAIADLMTIVDYISDDNPAAAQALKEDIEAKVSRRACLTAPAPHRGDCWEGAQGRFGFLNIRQTVQVLLDGSTV